MKIIKIFEDFKKEDYYVEIESFPSDKHPSRNRLFRFRFDI